jgi:hypothetical protein
MDTAPIFRGAENDGGTEPFMYVTTGAKNMMRWLTIIILVFLSIQTAQAQMVPLSATQYLPELRSHAAQNHAGDSFLVQVLFLPFIFKTSPVRYEIQYGIANGWFYRFYSPTRGGHAVYYAYRDLSQQLVIASTPTGVTVPPFAGQQALPDTWLDSPPANDAMRNAGAVTFMQAHPDAKVTFATVQHHAPADVLWSFWLVDGSDSLLCRLDAVSGQSAVCGPPTTTFIGATKPSPQLALGEINPHPISNGVGVLIPFRLEAAGVVEIRLFDISGRLVATPFVGFVSDGDHTRSWKPQNLSPGAYQLQLLSGEASVSRTVLLW